MQKGIIFDNSNELVIPTEPNDQGEWKCPICLQINKGGICNCGTNLIYIIIRITRSFIVP